MILILQIIGAVSLLSMISKFDDWLTTETKKAKEEARKNKDE